MIGVCRMNMKKITHLAILASAMAIPGISLGQARIDPFAGSQGATNKEVQANAIASVEFVDTPITVVFKMVSDLTGWSIIMSPEVSKAPPKINIWIKNMPPDQVLERIASLGKLIVERKGSVVEVMTFDEYQKIRGLEKTVVRIKSANVSEIAATIQNLVDKDQSKIIPDPDTNQLIMLVPAAQADSLKKLIENLDIPFEKDSVRLVKLKYLDAESVAAKLEKFLVESSQQMKDSKASGRVGKDSSGQPGLSPEGGDTNSKRVGDQWLIKFMVEPRLNTIILRGLPSDVAQAELLIQKIDIESDVTVVGYTMQYTSAREVYDTIQSMVTSDRRADGAGSSRVKVALSDQNNRLVIEGAAEDHRRIRSIIDQIDQPLPASSGGTRVYRLENSSANEVAEIVSAVVDQKGRDAVIARKPSSTGDGGSGVGFRSSSSSPMAGSASGVGTSGYNPGSSSGKASDSQASTGDVVPATVTAAPEINAIIIRASAAEHEELSSLIRELDKPRDQVMLEVTLVSVRSTDYFNLGVELSAAGINSKNPDIIGFNSYGIGSVDSTTGALSFDSTPPLGFNFGVFKSDDFSVVMNALKTVGDTRVTSKPRILVEDNTPAEIKQLSKEPYSVSSQGNNTTVTSLGGFAEAGTTLTVIPHVAKDDWLRLEYSVDLSSFDTRNAEQLAANLPPPIRQNTSQGTVRLPADSVVVLGGLATTKKEKTKSGIPFLSEIPFIGDAFGSQSDNNVNETLYIFIRPIVLRDRAFKDLIYLSESDIARSKMELGGYPQNGMRLIEPFSRSSTSESQNVK